MLLKTRGRGTFYYKKCLRLQNRPGIVRYLQFRVTTNNLQLKLVFMLSIFSPESRVNKGLENKNCNTVALKKTEDPLDLLYKKLGHPHEKVLKRKLSKCNIYSHINKSSIALPSFFQACQYGTSHKLHFSTTETKTTKPLKVIHTNL